MSARVRVGGVTWNWTTHMVCAGPEERLIVVPDPEGDPVRARGGLEGALRMEWRDGSFRKWRIHREAGGIIFSSHYVRLGPAPIGRSELLAGMTSERLEEALTLAREREGE
ncbi:MAG: hypothetical protein OEO23_11450 [Gemmatimonadota bacterium]|nr:hypothetical protein [Gemmatimonadota bacterium]